MEMVNSKEGKNENTKTEELQRITVTKEVQGALTAVVEKVNDGFSGGKVNRTQMANWIITRFNEQLDDAEIKEIRAEHFDEVAMLESILRRAKESGKLPSEFRGLLQKQLGFDEGAKKKIKKALTDNVTNGDI